MAVVPIIQKPIQWLAEQITELVSIMVGLSVMKSYTLNNNSVS